MKKKVLIYAGIGTLVTGICFGAGYLGASVGRNTETPKVTEAIVEKDGMADVKVPDLDKDVGDPSTEQELKPATSKTTPQKDTENSNSQDQDEEIKVEVEKKAEETAKDTMKTASAKTEASQESKANTTANSSDRQYNDKGQEVLYDGGDGGQVIVTPDGDIAVTSTNPALNDVSEEVLNKAAEYHAQTPEMKAYAEELEKEKQENKKALEELQKQQAEEVPLKF